MRSCKFSDPEHEVDLILSRAGILETPKDIDDFTNCPTQKISVLGGIVVPIADVGCHKKCPAMVKVGLSRFQKLIGGIGKRVLQIVPKMSGKFVQSGFGK